MSKKAFPKQSLKRKRFHEHYSSDKQNAKEDWVIKLIDSADVLKELRRKELNCIYKLQSYVPHGLIESYVYEAF